MNSTRFELLKSRWELGWITRETLLGWVELEKACPGAGITRQEYDEICGEAG